MRRRLVVACLAGAGALTGCKTRGDSTQVKIINGVEATGDTGIVQLMIKKGNQWSGCTGSYLDPTTVLTALHCIADGMTGATFPAVVANIDGSAPMAAYFDTDFLKNLHNRVFPPDHDVAVLKYDPKYGVQAGVFNYLKVSGDAEPAGAPVRLIGFGATEVGGAVSDTLQTGTNILGFVGDGYLAVVGVARASDRHPPGQGVGVAGGDSGGPLLNAKGEIIGICSFDQWDLMRNWTLAQYFDAQNPLLQTLLTRAASGAPSDAPGLAAAAAAAGSAPGATTGSTPAAGAATTPATGTAPAPATGAAAAPAAGGPAP